ncbi:MAG: hypothetical protein OHK0039_45480 [Bacteroidia bacterium]
MRLLPCLLLLMLPLATTAQYHPLRVMSFNIRLNTPADGYNAWPKRTYLVESMVRYHRADLLGVQEALEGQMQDLARMLPDFASAGVARDTGAWAEYSAIWYRRSRFDLLDSGTFWLSETPDSMSRGWDAALNRIATWVRLRDRASGKTFLYVNTHFDHRGETARQESARLILQQIAALNPTGLPVILSGDFNADPTSQPYRILADPADPLAMRDVVDLSLAPLHGPASTWSGFQFPGEPGRRIDYVFVKGAVQVLRSAVLAESWSGRFPSDHLPMLAEVLIDPVHPLPQAHAHNDYEHPRPLFDALAAGFTSVEADVWLIDGVFYVAHDRPRKPDPARTLRSLYLEPLAQRLRTQEGWVYPGYRERFLLMIDFKNEGLAAYEQLQRELDAYRWMLDGSQPGPVEVFLSGDRPLEHILADPQRWLAVDGRPQELGRDIPVAAMPVVSARYGDLLTWQGQGPVPQADRDTLAAVVRQAHLEGRKVRLWASPEREAVWTFLLDSGVDLINTDELERLRVFLMQRTKL